MNPLQITSTPARLSVNFEELKRSLQDELKQYEIVVTADTVSQAKALATELNQTKGLIDKRRKEEVARASEPVKAFDGQMKELTALCESGRQAILEQVKTFEDKTRDEVQRLLAAKVVDLWAAQGVEAEFRRTTTSDLVIVSHLTGSGNLTAKAAGEVERRVSADKALQDQTRMRLLQLENASYKAGLAAPLVRAHVEHFLFAEAAVYQDKLELTLDAEVEREKVARDRYAAEQKAQADQQARADQAEQARQARLKTQQMADAMTPSEAPQEAKADDPAPTPPETPKAAQAKPGARQNCTVTCTFSITVTGDTTKADVEAQLRKVMTKAGITTLATVEVAFQ